MHSYLLKVVKAGETLVERRLPAQCQSELWDCVAQTALESEVQDERGARIQIFDARGGMLISVGIVSARQMARDRAA